MVEPSVPAEALRELLRQIHSGVALVAAAAEAVARLEALFDRLAEVEAEGKRLLGG